MTKSSAASLFERPHRRYNPLTGEYVLVSPQRATRPWQGKVEEPALQSREKYDPNCYLCPGNLRANGDQNPNYNDIYIFTNDFPALLDDARLGEEQSAPLFQANQARGTNKVICFSPRHDLTLAEMEVADIEKVIQSWIDQYLELGEVYQWVQVFQNHGEMMGASNPHPHCQVWAIDALPNEPCKEEQHQKEYRQAHDSTLLLDYVSQELDKEERVVIEQDHWAVVVPFWAIWPFETLVLPKRHVPQMPDLREAEIWDLAVILKKLLMKYDRLFGVSFPYSMGWHGAPFKDGDNSHWQLHAHFYPPLLRSATVKKFMVGYEMLAEAQRDLTPELAAQRLKRTPAG